ncbi:MAG: NAD(P)-binding domain-containing protein, partial [Firmicutes bacterium]|nr:NAD(P)-binding domain-containing protein [Bacillota bacterium]
MASLRRRLAGPGRRREHGGVRPLHALVVGAGAVGGLCAAALNAGGADVTVVSRSGGRSGELRVHAWDEVPSEAVRRAEAVLVCVKAYATAEVADRLKAAGLPPGACVVSLQNGLGNEETLAAAGEGWAVVAGALTTAVRREGGGAAAA